jgi:hypothetical protein
MEGMIWHANEILQKAISSKTSGLPKNIVENCHGVILISVVEVGAIFSGSVGSGIVLAKDPAAPGMKWSPPWYVVLFTTLRCLKCCAITHNRHAHLSTTDTLFFCFVIIVRVALAVLALDSSSVVPIRTF